MNDLRIAITVFALLWLVGPEIDAHHSFPETLNTSQVVEIRGSVVALRWTNPHVSFSVLADDGSVWKIETNSIGGLNRVGLNQPDLAMGKQVKVAGFPARNGDAVMYASHLLSEAQREFILRPNTEPRWRVTH